MAASTTLVNEVHAQSPCHEAVQGEIAWNEAGTTRWATRNVDRLCEGAEDTVEPARCFDEVMYGGVDWGGGTTWEWENAIALCQGTQYSEATVRCFEEKIEDGIGWRSAIDTCQQAEEGADNIGPSIPIDPDVVQDYVEKSRYPTGPPGWTAGTGWVPVGGLTDATHIAACEATVFALTTDGRLHQQFSTDRTREWSLSHRFDQEIQSLICNRRLLYLDGRRRLFAGTNQLGRPYAAADLVAAEKSGPFPSTYYALNDDRTLWRNRGEPDDNGWRRIGRPADAKRLAAVRGALLALNDDGTLHVTRKPGDSRYWSQLGRIEGAVDITAVYAPEIDGAVLFAVHENGRVYRGEVESLLRGLAPSSRMNPKPVVDHPRLAPTPAIHFDHYNSSVTDLSGPWPERVDVEFTRYDFPMGLCLNYLLDARGRIYAFCGNSLGVGGRIAFELTLFDDGLEKLDTFEVVRFPSLSLLRGDLPMNLGYFVMDYRGRVILVQDETTVVFVERDRDQLRSVQRWELREPLLRHLRQELGGATMEAFDDQSIAQVFPAYESGYWIMSLGAFEDGEVEAPAYAAFLSDEGRVLDMHVFRGEVIENGITVDRSGAYVVTDRALYKLAFEDEIEVLWHKPYDRASRPKPGTLSEWGSGSTPTLLGEDLIAFTDNAPGRIHLVVRERTSGRRVCKQPLFRAGKSANENSVLAYGKSIVVQNWWGSPDFTDDMWGLEPGLTRIDVRDDGCEVVWYNETFASTPTIRLSTQTGLLYGTIQTAEDDAYAMSFIDFATGKEIDKVPIGEGRKYRLSMSPAYFVPGGRLIQPVRRGIVSLQNP